MKVTTRLRITAILLTVTGLFVACNIYTLIPIYDEVSHSLSIDVNHVVTASSFFTFFYAIGLLSFGPASDRFGRRQVLIAGMLASSISTLFVGLADDTLSLVAARSFQGVTLGSFAPVAFAYIFDLYEVKKRTLLLVFINTSFLMAGIVGQLISSSITTITTWNYTFYFFAVCYLFLFLISFLTLPKTKPPTKEERSVASIMGDLIKNKSLQKCYWVAFTLLFSFVAFYDAIGRFFDGSEEQLFTLRAVGLTGAMLSLFTSKLIERFGIARTMYTGFIIGASSILLLNFFQNLQAFMILSIMFVASISLLIPTIITLIGQLGRVHRAKALSIYSFVLLTGASLAPPIVLLLNFKLVLLLLVCLFLLNMIAGHFISIEFRKKGPYL